MVGTRVYVGGLPYGVRERDLERFFKGYGRTREILLKNGYGFVEFDDHRDADDAVYELNGKELMGEDRHVKKVTVEMAKGTPRTGYRDRYYDNDRRGFNNHRNDRNRYNNDKSSSKFGPPQRTEHRVIVENLSSGVSWQDLKDYMRQAGEVTYADAHKLRRNEGVVEFASASDMKTAMDKLDDTELNGRRIRLVEGRRGGGRFGNRGRSRSYSRSRSRSRSRRRTRSRSRRSDSRSRSRSVSKGRDRSKSKSGAKKSVSRSRSRSVNGKRSKSRSVSKHDSRSRSRSLKRDSRSKSRSRDRSASEDRRSASTKKRNGGSPDRNESMEE